MSCIAVSLQVPLTVVHREGLPLDGAAPALLVAYGAYGECLDPDFEVGLALGSLSHVCCGVAC